MSSWTQIHRYYGETFTVALNLTSAQTSVNPYKRVNGPTGRKRPFHGWRERPNDGIPFTVENQWTVNGTEFSPVPKSFTVNGQRAGRRTARVNGPLNGTLNGLERRLNGTVRARLCT